MRAVVVALLCTLGLAGCGRYADYESVEACVESWNQHAAEHGSPFTGDRARVEVSDRYDGPWKVAGCWITSITDSGCAWASKGEWTDGWQFGDDPGACDASGADTYEVVPDGRLGQPAQLPPRHISQPSATTTIAAPIVSAASPKSFEAGSSVGVHCGSDVLRRRTAAQEPPDCADRSDERNRKRNSASG